MKNRFGYYIWILSLAIVLMLLILAAQFFTVKNINGLKTGNRDAAVTFTINNRLQEIVNTAAYLQAKLINANKDELNIATISDSLAVMGYNASVLEKLNIDTATKNNFIKLNALISRQVDVSFKFLEAEQKADISMKKKFADSLAILNLSESIYEAAVSIQKGLEAKLKRTFDQNTEASQKLATLNKIFGLITVAAILILGTIIIYRHLRQVSLINALEKANDEVKKSAMIKEQFLANMSHELRTPLNAIKGFSSLLQQTALNDEQQKFSDIIENSSNNLLQLVNDILDIAKIEAGQMTAENKEFDLKRMLQTLESMFMNTAKEKQLDFTWQIDTDVPQFLLGDPDKIYQMLVNLVNNAFKFTNHGFIYTRVSKQAESEKEIILQFKIEDSGIGIPLKKQELIFERFQQIRNPQDNFQKGTGLGLAIVKNMATLLKGSVSVNSSEGQGSVFTLILPFTKNNPENNQVNETAVHDNATVEFSGANVLVAEDNLVNQLLIIRFLKKYGIEPVVKENGEEVLQVLKKQHMDLLLLDIQMPVLDGYSTCINIRETGNKLPVVAMTAYVMDAEKEKCRAAGMDDYLAKPLDEAALRNILLKYLSGFIKNDIKTEEHNNNSFLLNLAGGDQQMAAVILNQVKEEIPVETGKLKKIISKNDITDLPAICHNLISSISPLGNNTNAMKKIAELQKMIVENETAKKILKNTQELVEELENCYNNLVTKKQQQN
jgi:signal transduction histidine kinase/CheY-like chemotaxis protein